MFFYTKIVLVLVAIALVAGEPADTPKKSAKQTLPVGRPKPGAQTAKPAPQEKSRPYPNGYFNVTESVFAREPEDECEYFPARFVAFPIGIPKSYYDKFSVTPLNWENLQKKFAKTHRLVAYDQVTGGARAFYLPSGATRAAKVEHENVADLTDYQPIHPYDTRKQIVIILCESLVLREMFYFGRFGMPEVIGNVIRKEMQTKEFIIMEIYPDTEREVNHLISLVLAAPITKLVWENKDNYNRHYGHMLKAEVVRVSEKFKKMKIDYGQGPVKDHKDFPQDLLAVLKKAEEVAKADFAKRVIKIAPDDYTTGKELRKAMGTHPPAGRSAAPTADK